MYETIEDARLHAARGAQLLQATVHIIACGAGFALTATPEDGETVLESFEPA